MKFLMFLSILFFFTNAFPGGLAVKGNYRARGTAIRNLQYDKSDGTRYRNYIDNRFRFNAAFVANDLILIRSDLDFFGNCADIKGNSVGCNLGQMAPDQATDRSRDNANNPSNEGLLNRSGGTSGNTLSVKRLWTEINTKYGILIVGRQPDEWGTGMFANSGDGVFDNYGDSLDRVAFDMKFGSLDMLPFYGNFSEGNIDRTGDFYEMGFKLKYHMVNTQNIYGFYLTSRSSRGSTDRLASYDLFANHNFGFLNLELELVFQNGNLHDQGIDATGVLAKFRAPWKSWVTPSFEIGSASGDNLNDNKFSAFYFNPDYRPTLIMFTHEYGERPYRLKGKNQTNEPYSYPSSVNNAIYLKPALQFKRDNSTYDLSFIWAQRQEPDRRSPKKNLGYEVDFSYNYLSNENLIYGADLGFHMPGDYYKYLDSTPQAPREKRITYSILAGLRLGVKF